MPSSQDSIERRPYKFHKARQRYPNNPANDQKAARPPFLILKSSLESKEQESRTRELIPIIGNLRRLCQQELGKHMKTCETDIKLNTWPGRTGSWKGENWSFWTLNTDCQRFIVYPVGSRYYAYLGPGKERSALPIAEPITKKSDERPEINNNRTILEFYAAKQGQGNVGMCSYTGK
jgi:hypothetical protein